MFLPTPDVVCVSFCSCKVGTPEVELCNPKADWVPLHIQKGGKVVISLKDFAKYAKR